MNPARPAFATASSEESSSYFDKATAVSSHYCVILNFPEARGIGSGTLVSIAGKFGILTAHHVSQLLQRTQGRFMICLGDTPTSLTVFESQYRNIVIGSHRNTLEHLGPDLSFIHIIDPPLLSRIKAKKSFHPLEENPLPGFDTEQLKKMVWFASGAPHELTEKGTLAGRPLTIYTLSHMAIQYHSTRIRKGFDYIRLRTTHGADGYPNRYGGVSGGGIWVLGLSHEDNEPQAILQGVVFYHYRPSKQSSESYLVAHGINSIYGALADSVSHTVSTFETPKRN